MKSVNMTTIDEVLFDITERLWKRTTTNRAEQCIAPLLWYINTGRAPTPFLKLLVNASESQKETIADRLLKQGSYDAAVNSVCQCLGHVRHRY